MKIQRGEEEVIAIGVKNTGDSNLNFTIQIDDLNKNFPQRLLNYFKLKQVRADLDVASQKKDKAVTGVRKNEEEKDRVKRSKERIPEGFESASRILEDFYTSQKHT